MADQPHSQVDMHSKDVTEEAYARIRLMGRFNMMPGYRHNCADGIISLMAYRREQKRQRNFALDGKLTSELNSTP